MRKGSSIRLSSTRDEIAGFRQNADECLVLAGQEENDGFRAEFLALASEWRHLAEEIEKRNRRDPVIRVRVN